MPLADGDVLIVETIALDSTDQVFIRFTNGETLGRSGDRLVPRLRS